MSKRDRLKLAAAKIAALERRGDVQEEEIFEIIKKEKLTLLDLLELDEIILKNLEKN